MDKYCAFDLEIVTDIPPGTYDWKSLRPLGISCAATMRSEDTEPVIWYHGYDKDPEPGGMTHEELYELVEYLVIQQEKGYKILTWNGLAFDLDVLAEESGRFDVVKEMAMQHVDMMFHFFCSKGYMLGLDKVAKSLGLAGKLEGMHGDLAPKMWAESLESRQLVLKYVGQDARTTLEVAEKCNELKGFSWISNSGRKNDFAFLPSFPFWMSVEDCLKHIPVPDTSWMSVARPRGDFFKWTNLTWDGG